MSTRSSARTLLARNMKRLREAAGISQAVLAERVGCSTTMVGNIEIQKRFPSAENIDRIAQAFQIQVYELFMEDSPAIPRASVREEVRERLERSILSAIDEALESGPRNGSDPKKASD